MFRSRSRVRTATALVVVVLALVVTAWRGAKLYVLRERVHTAADWIVAAGDWQETLFATARAIDAGALARTEDGGLTAPWDPPTFPVTIEDCEARMLELLGAYPLDLADHVQARTAFRGSGALLSVEAARVALEDVPLQDVVRALDRHGSDLGRLTTPVAVRLTEDADRMAVEAFLVIGALGLALLVVLALRP